MAMDRYVRVSEGNWQRFSVWDNLLCTYVAKCETADDADLVALALNEFIRAGEEARAAARVFPGADEQVVQR